MSPRRGRRRRCKRNKFDYVTPGGPLFSPRRSNNPTGRAAAGIGRPTRADCPAGRLQRPIWPCQSSSTSSLPRGRVDAARRAPMRAGPGPNCRAQVCACDESGAVRRAAGLISWRRPAKPPASRRLTMETSRRAWRLARRLLHFGGRASARHRRFGRNRYGAAPPARAGALCWAGGAAPARPSIVRLLLPLRVELARRSGRSGARLQYPARRAGGNLC